MKDTTIEEKRFASILEEINNYLQQARKDTKHSKNFSMKLIQDKIKATIIPVMNGEYRTKKTKK